MCLAKSLNQATGVEEDIRATSLVQKKKAPINQSQLAGTWTCYLLYN